MPMLSTPYTSPSTPGSSPMAPSVPYTSPNTPKSSSPSPFTPSPTTPTPSTPSPYVTPSTPSPSTPSPASIPPVTPSPSGGYRGYGSRSGSGTSGYWGRNPLKVPKILSLVTTIVKIFGPRALKVFGSRQTLYGALTDTNPDEMSALAREGTASLINSYAVQGFPLSTASVLMLFDNALTSTDSAAQQAIVFQQLNEAV